MIECRGWPLGHPVFRRMISASTGCVFCFRAGGVEPRPYEIGIFHRPRRGRRPRRPDLYKAYPPKKTATAVFLCFCLYQHAITMVDFVLYYLCGKTFEGFDFYFKICILPLHFY